MRIQRLLLLSPEVGRLLPEAWLELGCARFRQRRSFGDYSGAWGTCMEETSWQCEIGQEKSIRHISQAVDVASRYTPWRSSCLVQAAAAMTLLVRRKLDCTLYLAQPKMLRDNWQHMHGYGVGRSMLRENGRWERLPWWEYSGDVLGQLQIRGQRIKAVLCFSFSAI